MLNTQGEPRDGRSPRFPSSAFPRPPTPPISERVPQSPIHRVFLKRRAWGPRWAPPGLCSLAVVTSSVIDTREHSLFPESNDQDSPGDGDSLPRSLVR